MIGGDGIDTADASDATGAVVFTLGAAGDGTLTAAGIGSDTLSSIEVLIGGAFDDNLGGNASANALTGGGGNDTLSGFDGADTLQGGEGNDRLVWRQWV